MFLSDGLEQREGEKLFTMYSFVQATKKEFMIRVKATGEIHWQNNLIINNCILAVDP